jgi:prevent-host-death family protein
MVKNISVRQLRAHLADVLDGVTNNLDRYVISKCGKPEAVLMCVDDYESWLETLEIMSSKETMGDIKIARAELKAGKHFTFEEVFGRPQGNVKKKR